MSAERVDGSAHALVPVDEAGRLAALRRYAVLDTPPDGAFDRITALAARTFGVPIALISLVDRDRIWFKSRHGLDVPEIARDPGLCASAILQDDPWVVTDATVDPRTLANPLVAGDFGLRFYVAVPLTTSDGYSLGTLCVIDLEPRAVDEEQIRTLQQLAAIVMDEMELRLAARRERERLEEAKSDVVATLSHELRTPLSSVYGAAKTLLDPRIAPDEETRGALLGVIADETQRLSSIVNQIVAAAQLESGAIETSPQRFDPVELARRAVEAARTQLPDGLELELRSADGVPVVEADAGNVRRVLDQLLENAIRYSGDGGAIVLEVEPSDGGVRFRVSDDGIGIPLEQRERIFEPFMRLDPAQNGGAGLGLHLCRLLAAGMGGRVGVEAGNGRGSVFFLELPG